MKKVLNALFLLCVCAALFLAFLYVLVEIVGIVSLNGALAIWADTNLEALVCTMCSISAVVAYVMSYVCKWRSGD